MIVTTQMQIPFAALTAAQVKGMSLNQWANSVLGEIFLTRAHQIDWCEKIKRPWPKDARAFVESLPIQVFFADEFFGGDGEFAGAAFFVAGAGAQLEWPVRPHSKLRNRNKPSNMNPRIYIETSVFSYLTSRDSTSLTGAARQLTTRRWWERRAEFDLLISEVVLREVQIG